MPRRREARPFAPALRRVAEDLRPRTLLAEVQMVWDDVAGPVFAGRTVPEHERDGVITVAAGDAVHAQELELLSARVVVALNARLGRPAVRDLRVQARPPRSLSESPDPRDRRGSPQIASKRPQSG